MSLDLPPGVLAVEATCRHCGKAWGHQSHPSGKPPEDGDRTVCWCCRKLSIFVVGPLGISLRAPSDQELLGALREPDVKEAYATLAESCDPVQALQLRKDRRPLDDAARQEILAEFGRMVQGTPVPVVREEVAERVRQLTVEVYRRWGQPGVDELERLAEEMRLP